MARETNFYLILTRMLNEIKSCDETDSSFKTNMEKIYKWYLQNRTPPRNKKVVIDFYKSYFNLTSSI